MYAQQGVPRKLTGKERWTHLIGLQRIKSELESIVIYAIINPRQTLAERLHWSKDLRRGRARVYGGLLRFFDVLAMRNSSGEGRAYALKLLGMLGQYIDAVMPETPAKPAAIDPPSRIFLKPVPHVGVSVIKRSA